MEDGILSAMPYIQVKVTPSARTERFEVRNDGLFVIAVREKPKDDEANIRVLALLAKHLKVPKTSLRIKRGLRGRNKLIEIAE
ncbi:MAG: hypothetical protein AMXMBFR44_2990 [Candidatus Campbellbacteria bacterium]